MASRAPLESHWKDDSHSDNVVAFQHLIVSCACPKHAFQLSCDGHLLRLSNFEGVVLTFVDGQSVPMVYSQSSNYLPAESKGGGFETSLNVTNGFFTCLTFISVVFLFIKLFIYESVNILNPRKIPIPIVNKYSGPTIFDGLQCHINHECQGRWGSAGHASKDLGQWDRNSWLL